ncbi:MAG: VanZ family protein [Anaerorhabdus sp.]
MGKRIFATLALCGFILLNGYWIINHNDLGVMTQIVVVLASVFLYVLAALLFVHLSKKEKRLKVGRFWMIGLLGYYLFFVTTVVFLDGYFFSRQWQWETNTTFFYTIKSYVDRFAKGDIIHAVGNLIGNTILFVPFGILLPLIHPIFRKWSIFLITVFAVAASIEFLQYRLAIGSADVDDIFLNVVGAVCSFALTTGLLTLFRTSLSDYFDK